MSDAPTIRTLHPQPGADFSAMEVTLPNRNKGMPLEALRSDITPVGLHYLHTHFDIPLLEPALIDSTSAGWSWSP